MATSVTKRNFCKDIRNHKKNQDVDETALRDEILELKRQVMVLRRTNEQNLVKFRKYEDEAKRKDREIEQLLDPRKNADVTKVLSTKGAAILMTLKDQNNALIQMVLNKDVQIRRLLTEMKMTKLYASTRKNVSYKEEIVRLKNLLVKSQEKLDKYVDKQNQTKSILTNESSFLAFPLPSSSSSSGETSPRDLDELRLVIRNLEAHMKHSNDLLNQKDQEISILTDEINFLKSLFQHKTPKAKPFDSQLLDTHSLAQTRGLETASQPAKILGEELLRHCDKSADLEDKNLSSSAPTSCTILHFSNEITPKQNFLSNITGNENWEGSKPEPEKETKADSALLDDFSREDSNETISFKLKKVDKAKERKKILTKHREPKKRNPKKFSGNAKKKKFNESDKKSGNIKPNFEIFELKNKEDTENGQVGPELFNAMDLKENEEVNATQEALPNVENPGVDKNDSKMFQLEREESDEIERDSPSLTVNGDSYNVEKEPETPEPFNDSEENLIMNRVSEGSTEIIRRNSPVKLESVKMNEEEIRSVDFRREIYQQSFDSSFESENGYPMKQQIQQVQVEVQINSILIHNGGDELGNLISEETSHQGELTETRGDICAPDDNNDNNDDDNDVVVR